MSDRLGLCDVGNFVAHSHSLHDRCVRFRPAVASRSCNTRYRGGLLGLARVGLSPTGPRQLSWRTRRLLDPPYHSVRRVFPSTAGRMAFRTAPSQRVGQLKPAPGMRWPRIGLLPPFVHRVRIHEYPAQGRVGYAPMHRRGGWVILLPRGPRSGPGCAVPVRHHLIDPIRPTRRHIATSPQGGLYAMPSLCGSA